MTATEWLERRGREIAQALAESMGRHRDALAAHQGVEQALKALGGAEAEARALAQRSEQWAKDEAAKVLAGIAEERTALEAEYRKVAEALAQETAQVLDLQGRANVGQAVAASIGGVAPEAPDATAGTAGAGSA